MSSLAIKLAGSLHTSAVAVAAKAACHFTSCVSSSYNLTGLRFSVLLQGFNHWYRDDLKVLVPQNHSTAISTRWIESNTCTEMLCKAITIGFLWTLSPWLVHPESYQAATRCWKWKPPLVVSCWFFSPPSRQSILRLDLELSSHFGTKQMRFPWGREDTRAKLTIRSNLKTLTFKKHFTGKSNLK